MVITTGNRLFSSKDLRQFLDKRLTELRGELYSEDDDEILNNGDTVAARLLKEYSLEPIRVDKDKRNKVIESNKRELTVKFSIPFTGSEELLRCSSGPFTFDTVFGNVHNDQIVVSIKNANTDSEPFKREFDSWYNNIEKWLDDVNGQAKHFNDSLSQNIEVWIKERTKAIRSARDILSDL